MYTLQKIRDDYYSLVKKVENCRGQSDRETVKNLLDRFGRFAVDVNGSYAENYNGSVINCIRVDYADSLGCVYLWDWQLGNGKMDITFDIYSDCADDVVISDIRIGDLYDEYWDYLKEDRNTEELVVTKVSCDICEKVKIVRGFQNAERVLIDWVSEDLARIYQYQDIRKHDVKDVIYEDFKNDDIRISQNGIYTFNGDGYEYSIMVPEV